jgi:AraC-like DNA-binding protein
VNRRASGECTIPLVHVTLISSYVRLLSDIGAPVERELARVNLPSDVADRGSGYLPCRSLCKFVDRAARSQGIDDIGARVSHNAGLECLQQGTVGRISASPTLLMGLRTLCNMARRESSQVSLWCEERDEELLLCHRGSLPRDVPGQVPMTWWGLGAFVAVIRLFLGPRWTPARMGVPAQGPAGPFTRELFPGTRMVAEPDHAWVAVPRSKLSTPARPHFDPSTPAPLHIEQPPEDFAESLRHVLRLYLPGGVPGLHKTAEILGTSARTLQRRLSEQKRNYLALAEETRFEFARDRLAVDGSKVIDVAYDAGYTDPSHFTRAFRRIAGVTPREYQRVLSQVS